MELPDGSFSASDIQDYFENIKEKHDTFTDNSLHIKIYVFKIENRITFGIKTSHHLQLLSPETMKLLGSTKSTITNNEDGENLPHLKITEAVLVHCNIVNNDYQ